MDEGPYTILFTAVGVGALPALNGRILKGRVVFGRAPTRAEVEQAASQALTAQYSRVTMGTIPLLQVILPFQTEDEHGHLYELTSALQLRDGCTLHCTVAAAASYVQQNPGQLHQLQEQINRLAHELGCERRARQNLEDQLTNLTADLTNHIANGSKQEQIDRLAHELGCERHARQQLEEQLTNRTHDFTNCIADLSKRLGDMEGVPPRHSAQGPDQLSSDTNTQGADAATAGSSGLVAAPGGGQGPPAGVEVGTNGDWAFIPQSPRGVSNPPPHQHHGMVQRGGRGRGRGRGSSQPKWNGVTPPGW
eukprot:TRINITY_DN720_c0_g1_i4.p1 TRINITY_DN720_c0_g1~~TRINITY_DN720_c0_g1_i4.p1  ORF type:complete len:307 (+),score=70.70 TRINITY_DN720_c0_g1_i4:120-1040(+)